MRTALKLRRGTPNGAESSKRRCDKMGEKWGRRVRETRQVSYLPMLSEEFEVKGHGGSLINTGC